MGRGLRCPSDSETDINVYTAVQMSGLRDEGKGLPSSASQPGCTVSTVTARESQRAALSRLTTSPEARLTNGSAGYLRNGVIDNGVGREAEAELPQSNQT